MRDMPKFGPLEEAKSLAIGEGYEVVYDPRERGPLNLTGAVQLSRWKGVSAPNGKYVYACHNGTILAEAYLPAEQQPTLKAHSSPAEIANEAVRRKKAIGPDYPAFVLGGPIHAVTGGNIGE
jgi:hypothetical protein